MPGRLARRRWATAWRTRPRGDRSAYSTYTWAAGVTRTYLATKGVYRDAQGQVIGLIGVSRDVTELKRLRHDGLHEIVTPHDRGAARVVDDVVADEARATYGDGMLRIELPLIQPEPRSRSVPIEVDRSGEVLEG